MNGKIKNQYLPIYILTFGVSTPRMKVLLTA